MFLWDNFHIMFVVLCSEFENLEDLNLYQNHPDHLKVGEFINKIKEERIVTDYEV